MPKVYSTLPRPFSCRLVDNMGMVIYSIKPFVFYPDKPVEISDDIYQRLKAQYPDQISLSPYSELKDNEKYTDTPPGIPSGFFGGKSEESKIDVQKVTDGSLKPKKEAKKINLSEAIPKPSEEPPKGPEIATVNPYQDFIPILEEINDKTIEALTPQEIRDYAKQLGRNIPANIKKDKQREMLEAICQEIYGEYVKYLKQKVQPGV